MSRDNKVLWTEGMFLRSQHFQQTDRYFESLVRAVASNIRACPWGITELEIDDARLATGVIAINRCKGVFEDGTPFEISGQTEHTPILEPPANLKNATIYLGLPARRPGGVEAAATMDDAAETRYVGQEIEVADTLRGSASDALITVARMRLSLFHEKQELGGYTLLPIARLVERHADDSIVLDAKFIPSTLKCSAVGPLANAISEISGVLHHRGEEIAARLGTPGGAGVAEITDFLLLQVVNRHEALFGHYASLDSLHPEQLYATSVALAGELATFLGNNNRPATFPPYRHRDLQQTFEPVLENLRMMFSKQTERTAESIPLEKRRFGIRVAKIRDTSLFKDAMFVLAATSSLDTEVLRANLPKRITIGSVERIRELVNLSIGGVSISPLPAEPRQIPFRKGMIHFEINTSAKEWATVKGSGGMAVHVSGEMPDLSLELWAIRDS